MFTVRERDLLVDAVDALRAIYKRKINAESNPNIKVLLVETQVEIDILRNKIFAGGVQSDLTEKKK